jgi:nucleotide-binding universal stress UspA family protein
MFSKILVPLDGSSLAENALHHAVALAETFGGHCTLIRVMEAEPDGGQVQPVDALDWRIYKAEAQAYLEKQVQRLEAAGLAANLVVLEGQPAERIVEHIRENGIELLVLSSHGQSGLSRWNVSSVVHKIILHARVSTMITRAYRPVPEELTDFSYTRIMLPLDGSRRAECALPAVTMLAASQGAQLLVTHAVEKPKMPRRTPPSEEEQALIDTVVEHNRRTAAGYLETLKSELPVEFEPHLLVSDDVTASLHEFATDQEVDLVVICAHGYSGQRKWPFGSVATSFIEYGTTPLLIVQDMPPEEIEPTTAEVAAQEQRGH